MAHRIRTEHGDIEVFYEGRPQDAGQNERAQHLSHIEGGARAFGVVCDRDAPPAGMESSSIRDFDRNDLLALGDISKEPTGSWRAKILGSVSVSDYLASLPAVETEQEDIAQIQNEPGLTVTDRITLAKARLGQGTYKAKMLALWHHHCAVSGCAVPEALRASHAKPWRDSDNNERLNPHNGLPLVATLDTLFDAGLITFDQAGLDADLETHRRAARELLGLPARLRKTPTYEHATEPRAPRHLRHFPQARYDLRTIFFLAFALQHLRSLESEPSLPAFHMPFFVVDNFAYVKFRMPNLFLINSPNVETT